MLRLRLEFIMASVDVFAFIGACATRFRLRERTEGNSPRSSKYPQMKTEVQVIISDLEKHEHEERQRLVEAFGEKS